MKLPKAPAPRRRNVTEYSYNPNASTLTVTFHNGRRYRYTDVTPELADGLKQADSRGKFLHEKIIGTCPGCALDDRD